MCVKKYGAGKNTWECVHLSEGQAWILLTAFCCRKTGGSRSCSIFVALWLFNSLVPNHGMGCFFERAIGVPDGLRYSGYICI